MRGARRVFGIAFVMLLAAGWAPLTHAELRTVTSIGRAVVGADRTLDQAKHEALSQARTRAVEQAAGVSVSSVALLQDSLIVGQLVNTFAYGFLTQERAVTWTGTWSKGAGLELGFPVVEVRLDAVVDVRPPQFFRHDALAAKLDKQTYRDGEMAQLTLTARQDLYALVVNYTSQSNIVAVFPQDKTQPSLLRKGTTMSLPGANAQGWEIVMRNYPGHSRDSEAFLVLGFPVNERTSELAWRQLFPPGTELPYAEFFARVLSLPVDWIAQKTLVYSVVRE